MLAMALLLYAYQYWQEKAWREEKRETGAKKGAVTSTSVSLSFFKRREGAK